MNKPSYAAINKACHSQKRLQGNWRNSFVQTKIFRIQIEVPTGFKKVPKNNILHVEVCLALQLDFIMNTMITFSVIIQYLVCRNRMQEVEIRTSKSANLFSQQI